jgi:ribonuclease D
MDTHFLLPLRDRIEQELRAVGRWEEAQEVFATLTRIRWHEKEPVSFWRLSGARDLEPQQQAVLNALFDWREQRASQRDVPPYRVLRNEALVALARTLPRSEAELMRVPGVPRRFPSHLARKLVGIIRRAQKASPPLPPVRQSSGRRPDDNAMARYEALRQWRTAKAVERGVDPDVVMTNNVLMTIANAGPSNMGDLRALDVLGSWRLGEYGPDILRVISKERNS